MKDEKLKLKNIKDLEYNHLLNKQNIILIIIGTAVISIILSEKFAIKVAEYSGLILTLILTAILFLLHYSNKLNKIIEEMKRI